MTRSHALSATLVFLSASAAAAQQPAPRVVGAGGSGLQPQVATGPYQRQATAPAALGVNPFAGPAIPPATPPVTRFSLRQAAPPGVFAPPPAPGVPNNPAVFNPGVPPPFLVLIPPPEAVMNPVAFNPLFVSRRGVVSAYYVPPTTARSPSPVSYPGEDTLIPIDPEAGTTFTIPSGEYRFLPWIW